MIELGMHTDNWRSLSGNFQTAVNSAVKYELSHIEFGVIHGQYFIQGLGYDPSISLQSNPRGPAGIWTARAWLYRRSTARFP